MVEPAALPVTDSPWELLGLEAGPDEGAIRRAYATRVRQFRPDSHPAEFMRVREAYDAALAMARYLRWQQEQPQDDPQQAQPPAPGESGPQAPASAPASSPIHPDAAPGAATPSPSSQPRPSSTDQAPEAPDEALLPAAFDPEAALARVAAAHNEQGEAAAVAALHAQLAECARGTIDARLDFEAVFLRSLLTSETPPLSLVFEGDRCFRWSARPDDVAALFGDGGVRRLDLLVEMADHRVFAREYAPNAWARALFVPPDQRLPWWGLHARVREARALAQRWDLLCEHAQVPALQGSPHPQARRRLGGRMVLMPDLALGALVALVLHEEASGWQGELLAAAGLLIVLALCVGARELPYLIGLERAARWKARATFGPTIAVVVGAVMMFVAALAVSADGSAPVRVFAVAMLVLLGAFLFSFLFWLYWSIAAMLENLLGAPLRRTRDALAAQAFREMRRKDKGAWTAPSGGARLRALPSALRAVWNDAAQRRKSQRSLERQLGATGNGLHWRWIAVLIAIAAINGARHLFG